MSSLNPNPSNTNDLQEKIIQCIKHFSETKNFEIKDKFIQEKLNQISEQEVKLINFAKDYNLRMNAHADDLIIFAKSCEEDNLNRDELLKSLRKFKINENKLELLNQIGSIKNSLNEIYNEIADYITEEKSGFTSKINKVDKDKNEAISLAKVGVMIAGIGSIATTAAIPIASLALTFPASIVVTLGASFISQGTATATISAVVAGALSIRRNFLDNKLKNVKEQIMQLLQKMQTGLEDINAIIPHFESHFEKQSSEIEEVEEIMDVIKKFDDKHLIKPIARTISNRARRNSAGYNASDIKKAFEILSESDHI